MRANLPVMVLLGSFLPAAAESSPPPSERPLLRLVWIDPTSAASFAYTDMGREVRSILGAAGVDVAWGKGTSGPFAAGETVVILLDGEPARVGQRPHVMGCVAKGDGQSVLWVNFTTVARTLGLDPRSRTAWSGRERQQVATALGRVVAHETVHALAPQLPHATRGLLSATLNRHHLVHQRLLLDPDSADGFRQGIRLRDRSTAADGPALARSGPR